MLHVSLTGATTPVRRANAYQALTVALARPADWQPDFPTALSEAFSDHMGVLVALGKDLSIRAEAALADLEPVSVAHARLFFGPFEIQAAPWASFYLDPGQRLTGVASQYAARAYAEAGLGPSEDRPRGIPDHVTHELEFMYFLAFQEATTADHVWLERQRRFWNEHLGRWLPQFADAVERADTHPFYLALAVLLRAFCASEDGHFTPE